VLHRVNLRKQKRARSVINNRCTQIVRASKNVGLAATTAVAISSVSWRASIGMPGRMDTALKAVIPWV